MCHRADRECLFVKLERPCCAEYTSVLGKSNVLPHLSSPTNTNRFTPAPHSSEETPPVATRVHKTYTTSPTSPAVCAHPHSRHATFLLIEAIFTTAALRMDAASLSRGNGFSTSSSPTFSTGTGTPRC